MSDKLGKQTAETSAKTRGKILDAALTLFSEKGFEGASLREISGIAGTAHGLIRHYFGSKDDLWCAVVDASLEKLAARHLPLFEQFNTRPSVELLKAFVRNYIEVAAENPKFTRIMMNDCNLPGERLDYLMNRILPLHRKIDPIFEAVQKKGFLQQFTADSFLVFLMALGSHPFAVEAFNNRLMNAEIRSPEGINNHANLVLNTLFSSSSV